MKKILQFDVLIVYNSSAAYSADDESYRGRTPFSKNEDSSSCNASYAYFLQQCRRQGLRAAFTTTQDIIGPGTFRSVWVFDTTWKRIKEQAHSVFVFDKFSHLHENRKLYKLLTSTGEVQFFHSKKIRELFDNKLNTFSFLGKLAVPTVSIDLHSHKKITAAKNKLDQQSPAFHAIDDRDKKYIIKDQFGAGGTCVFSAKKNTTFLSIGKKNPEVQFILQPHIDTSGFKIGKYTGNVDLRLIMSDAVIEQCYIRIPAAGEFRANASLGGKVVYLQDADIPKDVVTMAKKITKRLPTKSGLYALDFIKSSAGRLYCIEGNSTPGLNWFNPVDELYAKKMIRLIIHKIHTMV